MPRLHKQVTTASTAPAPALRAAAPHACLPVSATKPRLPVQGGSTINSASIFWLGLGLMLLPAAAAAQTSGPAANPSLHASVNGVRDAAHERDLGLRRFDIIVRVRGAVAETEV